MTIDATPLSGGDISLSREAENESEIGVGPPGLALNHPREFLAFPQYAPLIPAC